jgi:hypothetical protein
MKASRVTILSILPALAICGACRQSKSKSLRPTLAIEFQSTAAEAPSQLAIPDGGAGTGTLADPLPGESSKTALPLSLWFDSNGSKVTALVYAIGPETDPLRYSDGHKHLLGRHSARVNERIELNELKKLGYQPIVLKVVRFTPPQSAHPALISNVPSLQITLADPDIQSYMMPLGMDSCTVVLHNLSTRGVVAYILSDGADPRQGIAWSTEATGSYGNPAIAPHGVSRNEHITFDNANSRTPYQVIVAAAIFTDGSHEGEENLAAQLEAKQIGKLVVSRIVTPAIDEIVGTPAISDDARIARVKEEIFRVPSQPDQATIRIVHAQFSSLPLPVIVQDLSRGIDAAKNQIWGDLYSYMNNCCQYPPPDHVSLSEWWRTRRPSMDPGLNSPR